MASPAEPGGLLLVADVGPGSGLGHLQRSLALGEAWAEAGGVAEAIVPADRGAIADRVRGAGLTPVLTPGAQPPTPAAIADAARGRTWAVLDGYDFGVDHRRAAGTAARVAVIDDHGRSPAATADVDVIIGHNPGASASPYESSRAQVLAGARYTLVRAEHRPPGPSAPADRLVVVMGGSPTAATVDFVRALLDEVDVADDRVDLVGLFPADRNGSGHRVIAPDEPLAPVFRAARLAVSAAGSTTWELAAAGTACVLVATAENQVPLGQAAARSGIAHFLGSRDRVTPSGAAAAVNALWADREATTAMGERGRALIDGAGPARVVAALRAVAVRLRPASVEDARLLWRWANERRVREMAFTPDRIAWSDHRRWLEQRLDDAGSWIYLADDGERPPWGQVRFDRTDDGEVETSVIIDPEHRGLGLGAPLLVAATAQLRDDCAELRRVQARIKCVNRASVASFHKAGFTGVGCAEDVCTLEWRP